MIGLQTFFATNISTNARGFSIECCNYCVYVINSHGRRKGGQGSLVPPQDFEI